MTTLWRYIEGRLFSNVLWDCWPKWLCHWIMTTVYNNKAELLKIWPLYHKILSLNGNLAFKDNSFAIGPILIGAPTLQIHCIGCRYWDKFTDFTTCGIQDSTMGTFMKIALCLFLKCLICISLFANVNSFIIPNCCIDVYDTFPLV